MQMTLYGETDRLHFIFVCANELHCTEYIFTNSSNFTFVFGDVLAELFIFIKQLTLLLWQGTANINIDEKNEIEKRMGHIRKQ